MSRYPTRRVLVPTLLIASLALTGCDPQISEGKRALEAKLTDPGSVQYQKVVAYSGDVVCGEYNAKNSFGGYVGFKQFITLHGSLVTGDEFANYMTLCNNKTENKVAVDAFKLHYFDLNVVNSKTKEKRSWSAQVGIWVAADDKYKIEDSEKLLKESAQNFLEKDTRGLSSWADNNYDPARNESSQQALKLELQKLLKDIEIKGINLTAY